jgi:hypothetical protein
MDNTNGCNNRINASTSNYLSHYKHSHKSVDLGILKLGLDPSKFFLLF